MGHAITVGDLVMVAFGVAGAVVAGSIAIGAWFLWQTRR